MEITPSKRARIDFTTLSPTGNPAPPQAPASLLGEPTLDELSPTAYARRLITDTIASLPKQVRSITEKKATAHLSLLVKLSEKKTLIKKMESDKEFVPRSARVAFKLNGSKKAEGKSEFDVLQSLTQDLVEKFQADVTGLIKESIKIEVLVHQAEIQESLAWSIGFLVNMALTKNQGVDTTNAHAAVNFLVKLHAPAVLKYSGLTLDTFNALYKETYKLETFPPDTADVIDRWDLTRPVKCLITALFVAPFEYHQTRNKDVATAMALKQLCLETSTMEKTDEAMADIDQERAVGPEKLQELIDKKVAEKTKKLQNDLHKLKQSLTKKQPGSAKNVSQRGPSSASK